MAPDPLPKNSEPKIVQPADAPKENLPAPLRKVGIDQRLNNQVPLDLVFRDENGQEVKLAQYFGHKPVVLSLVYYDCPMLCTQVLNGLVGSLKALKFDVGRDFEVVTVSFDPREKPELARQKKEGYMVRYGREGAAAGWHFLTGDKASITALTEAVGFHFAWDEETQQFAHASGIMILTPEGKISRYFYGIEYAPRDMQLGLVEASNNKIGSPVDQILLYCFHYDPQTGRYGFVIMNAIRILGFATFAGLALLIFVLKRREAERQRALREA
ncbi:MAG: SCO family protein [Pyrinomonadaceae bacterium]|nr:SCO family protein [Pyrinomonadaceae bacterium]